MKKQFIDYLYELRASVQNDIDRLVELNKLTRNADCKDCGDEIQAELRTRRSQIGSINETIEKYFETHSRNL
jgi:transcription elongation factor Elf1